MKKTVCFTIDVEPDFAGILEADVYNGKSDLPKLERIVRKYGIKLTAFVTGKTLEENPDILESLKSMNAEIEQHSYAHLTTHGPKFKDIEEGIRVHEKLVGKSPLGYRAPQGVITQEEVRFLEHMGIKFDSSIFPAFFPGRYNRLNFPTSPFKIFGSNIIEFPFAVVRKIRLPISLSYMQLFGVGTFKFLFKIFGLPELLVYDFHTYEFGKLASYDSLPLPGKLAYYRAQRTYEDPASIFEWFVKFMLSTGYESKYMLDIYEEAKSQVSSWKWVGE
jgi:peptidoglycan/xylan/chitin deacetylase (PgdA/CDA1 family)